ncbi:MAG: DUF4340 domain-containing protein [Planctomycetota bacterium]|jgi:hypothetical protein
MKPRTLIILAVLLAMCIGYVAIKPLLRKEADLVGRPLFHRQIDNINRIEIFDDAGGKLELAKQDGQWSLVAPIEARANNAAVLPIVSTLSELTGEEAFPAAQPDEELTGLATPRWIVTLQTDSGPVVLHVGRRAPQLGTSAVQTYLRLPSDSDLSQPIYAVDVDFDELLRHPARHFRHKTLLEAPAGQITRVAVEGRHSFQLLRSDGGWQVKTRTFSAPADSSAANRLTAALSSIEAVDFVEDAPEDLSRYGLADGQQRLTVAFDVTTPTDDPEVAPQITTHMLHLGSVAGEHIYARLAGAAGVVLLKKSFDDTLQPDPTDLRDRRVLWFNPADISQVKIVAGGETVELIRSRGQWRMLEPLGGEANQRAVTSLLMGLASLRAKGFHDDPPSMDVFGLDTPTIEITLHATEGDLPYVFAVAARSDDTETAYARGTGSTSVFELAREDVGRIATGAEAYFGATLLELPEDATVTQVVIRRGKGSIVSLHRDERGNWLMGQPQDNLADRAKVRKLISMLNPLTASTIIAVTPKVPDELTEAADTINVTVVASGGERDDASSINRVIRVARIKDDTSPYQGVFVWQPGQKLAIVGKVSDDLYSTLTVNYRSRLIWDIDTAAVNRIAIQAGSDEPLVLTYQGDAWKLEADDLARVDSGEVNAYLAGLRRIYAKRFVPDSAEQHDAFGLDKPWLTVELSAGETVHRVIVAERGPDEYDSRYGVVDSLDTVLVLSADTVGKLARSANDFVKD